MTRNLSHGRTPRHNLDSFRYQSENQVAPLWAGYLAHASNRGGIRTDIHEGNAHPIALTDAALKLATGAEGII